MFNHFNTHILTALLHIHVCICTCVYVCVCVCIYVHTHTHTHTYIYIYMVTRIEILGKHLHVDGNSLFQTPVLLLENYGKTFTNILSLSLSLSHVHTHARTHAHARDPCTHTHTHTNPTNCTTTYSLYFLSNFILISSAYGNSTEQVVVQLLGYICNILKLNKSFSNEKCLLTLSKFQKPSLLYMPVRFQMLVRIKIKTIQDIQNCMVYEDSKNSAVLYRV